MRTSESRDTSQSMILVPLGTRSSQPDLRQSRANFGFAALDRAPPTGPAPAVFDRFRARGTGTGRAPAVTTPAQGPLANVIPIALTGIGGLSSFPRMACEKSTAMAARVNRLRRRTPALRALALVTSFALALAGTPMRAQAQGNLPLIRDAEIEQLLREYTAPILRDELANAQTAAIIAMLIGVGATIAGSRAGPNSGAGSIGGAALSAPQSIIERNLLSYVH